jgi:hypothetical protein
MTKVYNKNMGGARLSVKVRQLIACWLDSSAHLQHCPDVPSLQRWEATIETWVTKDCYPLLVRREVGSHGGERQIHVGTGRALAACDNSPAEWIFRRCLEGTVLTPDELFRRLSDRSLPAEQKLPVTRFLGARDERRCEYTGSFNRLPTFADENYHVVHIFDVGMDKKGRIIDLPLPMLILHSRRLLSPSNIVLVRSDLAGLVDFKCFRAEVLAWKQRRGIPVPAWLGSAEKVRTAGARR